ncbi:MAG: cysteine rich repeat-containing protein [Alphaproteobacteria bacterium]|nr:cysteine rich repeat-containing protein [Alphaproteobacteria bacterium]
MNGLVRLSLATRRLAEESKFAATGTLDLAVCSSRSRRYAVIAVVALIELGSSIGQAAAQQAAKGSARQACAADYQQFCSGVQPGGGRIVACLKQNAARLSPACQQALGAAKAGRPAPGSGS